MSEAKKCCMCGKGEDEVNCPAGESSITGNVVCQDCAEALVFKLGFDPDLMKQAMMEGFILQVIKGEAVNEDGECNCPRHLYQRLRGAKDAEKSDGTKENFYSSQEVTGTRH